MSWSLVVVMCVHGGGWEESNSLGTKRRVVLFRCLPCHFDHSISPNVCASLSASRHIHTHTGPESEPSMHLFYPLRVTAFLSVVHSTLWIGTTRRSAPNNGLSIPLTLVKQILILHTVRKPTHTHVYTDTYISKYFVSDGRSFVCSKVSLG